jgi:hypothetical protein
MNFILPHSAIVLLLKLVLSAIAYFIFMLILVRHDTMELIKLVLNWISPKRI